MIYPEAATFSRFLFLLLKVLKQYSLGSGLRKIYSWPIKITHGMEMVVVA